MTGMATFTPCDAKKSDYREQGRLHLFDGRTLDARRRYIFDETESGFAVFFAENPPRFFHRIALARIGPNFAGAATHFCADDRYDTRYEFRADGSFVIAHNVSGPRKAYAMETRYVRALL